MRDSGGPGPQAELESHRLIHAAREFFVEELRKKHDQLGGGEEAFRWCLRVKEVLTDYVSVVVVNSMDEENAATVFETLNDRGIGLSTPDLVRSFLLRRAPAGDIEEIMECWRGVLEVADEAKVEDFLRHYWLSRVGDLKTRRLYRAIRSQLEEDGADSLQFSRDLRRCAGIYRDIVSGRDDNAEIARLLKGIGMLGAKALLPPILSAYDTEPEEHRRSFMQALIVFYVRHVLIGKLENSRLETVVYGVAKQLREDGDYDSAIAAIQQASPSDDRFYDEFKTATVSRQGSARYLLRELEHAKRATGEVAVELPDRVHLEHIYPRTPEAARWANHAAVIDRLGNLTLLSSRMNQSIRNAPFAQKRQSYSQSDILLTSELAQLQEWSMHSV
jgi:tetratricopeptide (TPR) repeat protein